MWAAASWAHYKETLQLIIFTLVADMSVQSRKWPGDFGEELNIWCSGCRKSKRQVDVAVQVLLSAKQIS